MMSKEDNERFTRVGPGTPVGEVLRRYWWPVGFTDEVKGPRPEKVRLLGEEFVLFRDGKGELGLLDLLCPHRRTSLALGRVEPQGLRCCYHGWQFDVAGQCIDQPCEDVFMPEVRQRSYPVQEVAGLVFVYIGPLPAPLLPKYDLLAWRGGKSMVTSHVHYCNWLQGVENACDVSHVPWLHAGVYPEFAGQKPRITWSRVEWGLHWNMEFDGFRGTDTGEVIFPGHNRFVSGRAGSGPLSRDREIIHFITFRVPQDDVTFNQVLLGIYPDRENTRVTLGERNTVAGKYDEVDDGWWNIASLDQDRAALEGQGPVTDRTKEYLGPSDHGVVLYRNMLREAIRAVEEGRDPIGVIRNPSEHRVLSFDTHRFDLIPPLDQFAHAIE